MKKETYYGVVKLPTTDTAELISPRYKHLEEAFAWQAAHHITTPGDNTICSEYEVLENGTSKWIKDYIVPQNVFPIGDPKYLIIGGKLCNSSTLVPIPEDEPVFIFRGKDKRAISTLKSYLCRCSDMLHVDAVVKRLDEFEAFAKANHHRMKEPDTKISETNQLELDLG